MRIFPSVLSMQSLATDRAYAVISLDCSISSFDAIHSLPEHCACVYLEIYEPKCYYSISDTAIFLCSLCSLLNSSRILGNFALRLFHVSSSRRSAALTAYGQNFRTQVATEAFLLLRNYFVVTPTYILLLLDGNCINSNSAIIIMHSTVRKINFDPEFLGFSSVANVSHFFAITVESKGNFHINTFMFYFLMFLSCDNLRFFH